MLQNIWDRRLQSTNKSHVLISISANYCKFITWKYQLEQCKGSVLQMPMDPDWWVQAAVKAWHWQKSAFGKKKKEHNFKSWHCQIRICQYFTEQTRFSHPTPHYIYWHEEFHLYHRPAPCRGRLRTSFLLFCFLRFF